MAKKTSIVGLSLTEIANNGAHIAKLVAGTIASYTKVAKALHETACATFFHVAQGNDPKPLNDFYNGLRVNDKTALRVWFGEHASYTDIENGQTRMWLRFTEKDGFSLVKGCEAYRKDLFALGDATDMQTDLLALKPFYEKNVKTPSAITLEDLIRILGKAAESVTEKAKKENINLPADVLSLTTSIKNCTAKELAALEAIAK